MTCKKYCPQNLKKVIGAQTMTQAQLVQLRKSINIPIESANADEMNEVIHALSRTADAKGDVVQKGEEKCQPKLHQQWC